jgi:hypothetical protein
MISEAKLQANRENAQKSTGPTSALGKQRSSLNACRHGLTGQTVVMPDEDMKAFEAFMKEMVESLHVADAIERQLAVTWASCQWRINRATAIEENLLTMGNIVGAADNFQLEHPQVHNAMCNVKMFRSDSQEFSRIALYTQRLVNQSEKILKQLKQLQADRNYRQQKEMNQVVEIYKLHREQGLAFDPKAGGFVSTIADIEAYLHRQNLKNPDFIAQEAARNRKKSA